MVDQGAGTYTAMRQIIANELEVPVQQVHFQILDTSHAAADTGVGASRATRYSAMRPMRRSIQVKETFIARSRRHTRRLERSADADRNGLCSQRQRQTGFLSRCHCNARRRACACDGAYKNFENGPQAALVAQVAEVEVDVESRCQVSVEKLYHRP
jgi:CO/xanthine dehydrogenase Mo-binding subunit